MVGTTVDLFCGCGGWDEGARQLGLDTVGIELDGDAVATARAAGGHVIHGDVTTMHPTTFQPCDGLIASPPCTDFSKAGKQAGIEGKTGVLMWEVPRWVEQLRPRWVACEQVPPARKWWELFAGQFADLGYATWVGVLNAADYGVPQTRRRAFLLARRDGLPVGPPEPTHAKGGDEGLLGERKRWVSMAEALGWGMTDHPYKTLATSRSSGGGPDKEKLGGSGARKFVYGEMESGRWVVNTGRDWKKGGTRADAQKIPISSPAPTVTSNSTRAWIVHDQSGTDIDLTWPTTRPATTIANRALVPHPGANANRYNGATKSRNDGFKIEIEDALILQSFPANYPLHGNKTSQFRQVGNAVPPALAAAVLAQFAQ